MAGRLAALKEIFIRAKAGDRRLHHNDEDMKFENNKVNKRKDGPEEEEKEGIVVRRTSSDYQSFVDLSEEINEFFDAFGPSDYHQLDDGCPSDFTTHFFYSQGSCNQEHLHKTSRDEDSLILSCNYGFTLPKDPSCNIKCSWTTADPSTFLIRGKNYLDDHKKIKAEGTLMQMVGADWLKSDKREDELAGRHGSIVQKYAAMNGPEFFFIVNFQFPGHTTHNLAFYYMMNTSIKDASLLDKFIKGDDAYRNSRFKLIPYVFQGPWILKQTITKKPSLVGQVLKINYFRGKNYLELGIDIGSSTLARHVSALVLGYMTNLVGDLAFLIQGNTSEELPEVLLGTCRLNRLDLSKTVSVSV